MKFPRYSLNFIFSSLTLAIIITLSFWFSAKNDITDSRVQKNSSVPVMYIDTEFGKPLKTKFRNTDVKIEFKGITGNGRLRCRGNSTYLQPKKPYLLKLSEDADLLQNGKAGKKWVLLSNGTDNTSLRNAYATYLAKNVFTNLRWTPDFCYINLFLNGKFQGVYQLYEKIEMQQNRLNLPEESFIVVTNTRATKTYNFRSKICNTGFSLYDPDEEQSESEAQKKIDYINQIEQILFDENFADPVNGWRKYIAEEDLIDWYWLNEFTTNRDARMRDSCFMFYDSSDGLLHFGPAWDFDISCGNNDYEENYTVENYWIRTKSAWFRRLFEDDLFCKKVKQRWMECEPLIQDSYQWLSQTKKFINKSMDYDNRIWHTIGHYQWPHAHGWMYRRTYDDEYSYFINWLNSRAEWLNADMEN